MDAKSARPFVASSVSKPVIRYTLAESLFGDFHAAVRVWKRGSERGCSRGGLLFRSENHNANS